MKIISFKGNGVRGYLNYEINFRKDITFLIGVNGSGKTTVLKLIQGLMIPSYRILDMIDYDSVELKLTIDSDEKEIIIRSEKKNGKLSIYFEKNHQLLSSSIVPILMRKNSPEIDNLIEEDYNDYCKNFEQQPVCRLISELQNPLFVSLDRMPIDKDGSKLITGYGRYRRIPNPSIDECLISIQEAIYLQLRKNSRQQNTYILNFRNSVVKTFLKFDNDGQETFKSEDMESEIEKLDERENEFVDAIKGLDMDDVIKEAHSYFAKLRDILNILTSTDKKITNDEKTNALISWILSCSQLSKVDKIITIGHDYQNKMKKLEEPIARFIDCINTFFEEGGKKLIKSPSGELKVISEYYNGNDKRRKVNNITELSSGEKQLIAMFGTLIFPMEGKSSDVYIIDEPEISLHLAWQDNFVDALIKACPGYQFILATHSPNIVSTIERKNNCEDLSPKRLWN